MKPGPLARRAPILVALMAQGIAFVLVNLAAMAGLFASFTSAAQWWMVHGLTAAALARLAGLPWWWGPIQVALPFAVLTGLNSGVPGWVFAVLLLAALAVFGGGIATRVPLYLSNQAAAAALAGLLAGNPSPRAVDLGAGLGGPMRALARAIPGGRFVNVEASPLTALLAALLALGRPQVRTVWGDLFRHPLAEYDLIYAFLSPAPMADLWRKVQAEARPGTRFVSNTFPVPDQVPIQVIDLPGRADARLFVYIV